MVLEKTLERVLWTARRSNQSILKEINPEYSLEGLWPPDAKSQLNGHEFEQTLGDSEGQGNLVCCSPWGCRELDMTEQLNNDKISTKSR